MYSLMRLQNLQAFARRMALRSERTERVPCHVHSRGLAVHLAAVEQLPQAGKDALVEAAGREASQEAEMHARTSPPAPFRQQRVRPQQHLHR